MRFLKNMAVSDDLNFIRGLAAISVLCTHVRNALFVPHSQIISQSPLVKMLYFITGLGNEAVMIFFVLSGFLIGSSVYYEICSNTFLWVNYLINRLVRLYVVLIPALILSAFITYFSYSIFSENINYPDISLTNFFANILFLQTILTHSYAENLPLWSLSNEFWYYMIFPFLLFFLYQPNSIKRYLYLAIAIGIFLLIGKNKSLYFLIWLLGFIAYLLKPVHILRLKPQLRKFVSLIPLLSLIGEFILSRLHLISIIALDFTTAICFTTFLYIILHNDSLSRKKGWYFTLATRTASCSYTLYLIHYPIVMLIEKFFNPNWQPDINHILLGAIISFAIFLFAYRFSLLTESNTDKVKIYALSIFESLKHKHFLTR
jgi:peptidoglycan/LPS O-acetylase OafA/YrhL